MIVHPSLSRPKSDKLGEVPPERRPLGDHHLARPLDEPSSLLLDDAFSPRRFDLRFFSRTALTVSTVCHEKNVLSATRCSSNSSWPTPSPSSSRPSKKPSFRASYDRHPTRRRICEVSSRTARSPIPRQSTATICASTALRSRSTATKCFAE